jgi:hypothetical protein
LTIVDLIEIVVGNMSEFSDSGEMARSGCEFFETATELQAVYNTSRLPYIIYQEEGFLHYWRARSKNPVMRANAFIDVNKGFISVKAEGKISRFIYSETLGIPYNKLENDQILIENQSKMLVELGADINV